MPQSDSEKRDEVLKRMLKTPPKPHKRKDKELGDGNPDDASQNDTHKDESKAG